MLSLVLGACLYASLVQGAALRLLAGFALCVPALLAASLAVQYFVQIDPQVLKLIVFSLVLLALCLVVRKQDVFSILLALWSTLEISAFVTFGAWPSLSQYEDDGNLVLFPAAACLSLLAGALRRRRATA